MHFPSEARTMATLPFDRSIPHTILVAGQLSTVLGHIHVPRPRSVTITPARHHLHRVRFLMTLRKHTSQFQVTYQRA